LVSLPLPIPGKKLTTTACGCKIIQWLVMQITVRKYPNCRKMPLVELYILELTKLAKSRKEEDSNGFI